MYRNANFHLSQPIYGLGIVGDTFDHTTDEFYLAEEEAKGRAEVQEKTVLTAYRNKFSVEQIQLFSDLSEDRILEILQRNKLITE
jgi:hypothetical protein